jgi:hypothetical protein
LFTFSLIKKNKIKKFYFIGNINKKYIANGETFKMENLQFPSYKFLRQYRGNQTINNNNL